VESSEITSAAKGPLSEDKTRQDATSSSKEVSEGRSQKNATETKEVKQTDKGDRVMSLDPVEQTHPNYLNCLPT
jgi:hypothetical protein